MTVDNRYIDALLDDGTNANLVLPSSPAIIASQTRSANYQTVVSDEAGQLKSGEIAIIGMGNATILEGSDRLLFGITNGKAGDSYSGNFVVLEIDMP
jgi:hypothetical protein